VQMNADGADGAIGAAVSAQVTVRPVNLVERQASLDPRPPRSTYQPPPRPPPSLSSPPPPFPLFSASAPPPRSRSVSFPPLPPAGDGLDARGVWQEPTTAEDARDRLSRLVWFSGSNVVACDAAAIVELVHSCTHPGLRAHVQHVTAEYVDDTVSFLNG